MKIDERIIRNQQAAANPYQSVWVSASAGSGKTKVLSDRVLNLLLSDTRPEKILCLTFTKAAAAEMANRITNTLKSWTISSDEALIKSLSDLNGIPSTPELCQKARQLFINVLETPGNMKIMNIHAFCQSVLKRFPIEAHVPPQFTVIDEAQSAALMTQALHQTFLQPTFQADITYLSDYFNDKSIDELFKHISANEARYAQLFEQYGSFFAIKKELKKKFNLLKYQSENQLLIEHFYPQKTNDFTEEDVSNAKALLSEKSAEYFTQAGSVRDKIQKQGGSLLEEANALSDLWDKYRLYQVIESTGYVLHITEEVIKQYRKAKHEQSLLDYGDLIAKTRDLLSKSTMAQWVMYKMDEGIDHILVDEAQDTSPEQWEIIRLISEEFFAGQGRETPVIRTLFAVGDKKQSIYSFQGADPNEFERMHTYFEQRVSAAGHTFKTVPLNDSFRSVSAVLNMVNHLLDNPRANKGVLKAAEEAVHIPVRKGEGGLVEIWPLVTVPKEKEEEEQYALPTRSHTKHPMVLLAQKIADRIKKMLVDQEILISAQRPIEPKDILILVSKRTGIVNELVRALKEKNIPVAGIDRLNLSNHIAIQDLLAIAKFALLPEDDLNLATILKSPLIKLSEEELMDICVNRGSQTVWAHLQQTNTPLAEKLKQILNQADKMPVYEFFAYLLGTLEGRKSFMERLGYEANEAIDEFLNLCLVFEQEQTPSLQCFIDWFQNRDNIIKRDLDQSELNAVKIMTVHGSKGLQGNIVFLPDAQRLPTTDDKFLWLNDLPIWIARAALRCHQIEPLRAERKTAAEEEYHRLLYVALTRARDRLYICGWDKPKDKEKEETKKKKPTDSDKTANWYDLIQQSLPKECVQLTDGTIQMTCPQSVQPEKNQSLQPEQAALPPLPDWIKQAAPAETPLSKPLMPSRLGENEIPEESITRTSNEQALKRGSFIHKLLQYLPDIAPEKRKEVALRLKPDEIDIPPQIWDILDNPTFQILFGPNSAPETPIVGIVGHKAFSGQIDRLVIRDHEVWIVDYKTNRYVPETAEKVSAMYKIQLFAYKELIKNIFKDKIVRAFLLWTENLTIMEMTDVINKITTTDIEQKDLK